ncbi:MAG: IRE (iron responsive element), partial [Pirellulales bacterium]
MNERRSYVRKIVYLAVLVGLLVPMHFIGRPAARRAAGESVGSGYLARIREENKLTQSNLGEIDASSETMKLATLGLDNLAVSLLWSKAEHYKKVKDWDKLSEALNQIIKLQPNFVAVWKYQGWNLSYNVSVEFDDYRDRYAKVREGILFLKDGTRHNDKEPRLLTDVGWFTSSKIGRADESRPFRKLFRADKDFHADMPYRETDNWLAGREWMVRAEEL